MHDSRISSCSGGGRSSNSLRLSLLCILGCLSSVCCAEGARGLGPGRSRLLGEGCRSPSLEVRGRRTLKLLGHLRVVRLLRVERTRKLICLENVLGRISAFCADRGWLDVLICRLLRKAAKTGNTGREALY